MSDMNTFQGAFPQQQYPQQGYQGMPQVNQQMYTPRLWNQQYPPQQSTALPSYNIMQQNNTNLIWVQGESAAKSYMVPNGCNIALWDSENQTIYIKSVDMAGKPSMTILDYKNRDVLDSKTEEKVEALPTIEYATKEQLDAINAQITAINKRINELKPRNQNRKDVQK